MQHEFITATELARNVATSIDKVRVSGRSLYITKGAQTVAELCPPPREGFPIEQLSAFVASLPKLGSDGPSFRQDIDSMRQQAEIPGDPWAS